MTVAILACGKLGEGSRAAQSRHPPVAAMAYQYYDAHFKEGHKVKTVKDVEARGPDAG